MHFATHKLRWRDIAPGKRDFDEVLATQIVFELLRDFPHEQLERHGYYFLESCLDQLLVQRFGIWLCGWRSSEDGGPVQSQLNPEAPLDVQTLTVLTAVREWRSFLETVDHVIEQLPLTVDRYLANSIETAAARLLPIVLARTKAQDSWYNTWALSLNWYLEAQGFGDRRTRALVERIFRQGFDSWTTPTTLQSKDVCRSLGESLSTLGRPQQVDVPERWLEKRAHSAIPFAHFPERYPPLRCDGHLHYVREHEKDPKMLEALQASRRWAQGDKPLSLEILKQWQAKLQGGIPAELRTTESQAQLGLEHYGVAHLPKFEEKLLEANDKLVEPQWRAASVYLDIRLLRPFEDSSPQLARLALDAVLWRHGYALNYVEPILVIARATEETMERTQLALAVSDLLGDNRR